MTTKHFYKKLTALFTAVLLNFSLFAEAVIDDTFGYSLDIPEGYELSAAGNDNLSLAFNHKNLPVTLAVKIYDSKGDSLSVLQNAMQKIGSKEKPSIFTWNDSLCSVANAKFTVEVSDYEGWAVCAPTEKPGYFLTLLCYAPASMAKKCEFFIISTINSLKIGKSNTEGIFTTIAYPKEGAKALTLNIGGKKIQTKIDKIDLEASSFVINIEFNILTMYANHPLKMQAWKRYYRMIERDSKARIANVAEDVYKALYPEAKKQNAKQPELAYAQMLLSWVQNFEYAQTKASTAQNMNSGFTSLPAVLEGNGNDCDSRSMLLSILLSAKGIPCMMIFSPEYAHAMAAVKIKAPGQTFKNPKDGQEYLMGETTAKVNWGTIAQDHADRKKWMTIDAE